VQRAAVLRAISCVDARLWAAPSCLDARPLVLPEPVHDHTLFTTTTALSSNLPNDIVIETLTQLRQISSTTQDIA
jgi:hypothetical protein